eukprot:TRINITY_DN208_c0_g3_i16.p1 TRINITY_DN208_c0_g3~~TRINITY_DN208_c0_g3_i16.p1  ORF type:complete len:217 (-),score=27.88 TRINITY_DN208_c0_g3_i16:110-760(-)
MFPSPDYWSTMNLKYLTKSGQVGGVDAAVEFLCQSFVEHPWLNWICTKNTLQKHRWIFQKLIQYGLTSLRIWTITSVDGEILSISMWQDPNDQVPPLSGLASMGMLAKMGLTTTIRARRTGEKMDAIAKKLCPHPHWTLILVAVSRNYRHKGYGKMVLQPILHLADSQQIRCYVDMADDLSAPFFEAIGFTRKALINSDPLLNIPIGYALIRKPNL